MTSPPPPDPIPVEERRQALERVLASWTFSCSERLRVFLRYVCEASEIFRGGRRSISRR